MSAPKIRNQPLGRNFFDLFGTLREIFPQIRVDFSPNFVQIFGNSDLLSGKISNFRDFGTPSESGLV